MHADSEVESEQERSGRAKRLPRSVRERQILDAAVSVFARSGYHAASMDEISETAGISKPMIYAYLGSKEELFVASIQRESARLIETVGEVVDSGIPPDEQLWRGLRAFFEYVGDHRESWTVVHRQANIQGEPFAGELSEWRNRAVDLIGALLARAATAEGMRASAVEQVESFAAALVGACESLADWWLDHPEQTAHSLAARLMNLVWMGFGDLVTGNVWRPRAHQD